MYRKCMDNLVCSSAMEFPTPILRPVLLRRTLLRSYLHGTENKFGDKKDAKAKSDKWDYQHPSVIICPKCAYMIEKQKAITIYCSTIWCQYCGSNLWITGLHFGLLQSGLDLMPPAFMGPKLFLLIQMMEHGYLSWWKGLVCTRRWYAFDLQNVRTR